MRAIRVDKDDLLKKVQKNRDAHRGIFEEAVEGYRKRSVEILEEHIQKIKAGKLEEVYVRLPRPSDHTKDYDRVIEMLEMHEDTSIEIDEDHFASYVMDDWSWKNEFLATNSTYSATAKRLMT